MHPGGAVPPPPRRILPILALAVLAAPSCLVSSPPPPVPGQTPVTVVAPALDERLRELIATSPADTWHAALVDLREQVDLVRLAREMEAADLSVGERGAAVRRALLAVAGERRTRFEPLLDRLLEEGGLEYYRGVAIVNRVVVVARAGALERIAAHPRVKRVWAGRRILREAGRQPTPEHAPPPPGDAWALEAMGIDALRTRGLDGTGVRIGILDSGVSDMHVTFAGARETAVPSWFDPYTHRSDPYDSRGHGTQILACALGRPVDGREIGAAPGARWVAALANPRNTYDSVTMTLAADWMLFEARPRVLLNAWGHTPGECYEEDRPLIAAWRAAEILPVFPAGNGGPAPGTGEAPGSLTGFPPRGGPLLSVGALSPDLEVIARSARGPRPCGPDPFPLLAAPGSDLPVPVPGGRSGLLSGGGTSLAVGWLGGAAALLFQARPDLTVIELEEALVATSHDLPPAGPDDASGFGLVRADRALGWIERNIPPHLDRP